MEEKIEEKENVAATAVHSKGSNFFFQ